MIVDLKSEEKEKALLSLLGLSMNVPLHRNSTPPMAFSKRAKLTWRRLLLQDDKYYGKSSIGGYMELLKDVQQVSRDRDFSLVDLVAGAAGRKAAIRQIVLSSGKVPRVFPQEVYQILRSMSYPEFTAVADMKNDRYIVGAKSRIDSAPGLTGVLISSNFTARGNRWELRGSGGLVSISREGLRQYLEIKVPTKGIFYPYMGSLRDYPHDVWSILVVAYNDASRMFPFHRKFPRIPGQSPHILRGM